MAWGLIALAVLAGVSLGLAGGLSVTVRAQAETITLLREQRRVLRQMVSVQARVYRGATGSASQCADTLEYTLGWLGLPELAPSTLKGVEE